MDFGIDTLDSGGTADAPARSSTITLSVAALPAPRPAAHSSTCAALDGSVGSAGADPHCCLYGPVCVGTTHSNAPDSLLKSTGRPSERLDRHRGQRARSRFRVPAEVYAGASYLKPGASAKREHLLLPTINVNQVGRTKAAFGTLV